MKKIALLGFESLDREAKVLCGIFPSVSGGFGRRQHDAHRDDYHENQTRL